MEDLAIAVGVLEPEDNGLVEDAIGVLLFCLGIIAIIITGSAITP